MMNLNARDIVVVQVGFRFLIISLFTNEDSGSKIEIKNCSIFKNFFSHGNSLVNNLLHNVGQSRSVLGNFASDIKSKELAL